MNDRLLLISALAILACLVTTTAQAQVEFGGQVFVYIDTAPDGKTLLAKESSYEPLDGVGVVAKRGAVIAKTTTRGGGAFEFSQGEPGGYISEGGPLTILFSYEKEIFVPEVIQLAGIPGQLNRVHVTLLRPEQYKRLYGADALRIRLERVRNLLRNVDGEDGERLRSRYLEMFREYLGNRQR